MNKQETFDTVVAHLLKQNAQAKDSEGNCMYRIGNMSCAIGCLIPDSLYTISMEDKIVDVLYIEDNPLEDYIKQFDLELLCHLQRVHDYADQDHEADTIKESFIQGFHKVAIIHGLRYIE